jgi:hypothetical protein
LAQPAFTARQRAYASARNDKQVYTPQIVLNGVKPVVGSDRTKIEWLVNKAANNGGLPVVVAVSEAASAVTVEIGATPEGSASGEAWLLPIAKLREVAIGRGENKGRTIVYANVVRGLVRLGEWRGQPARFELPIDSARPSDADSYVVLLQAFDEAKPGAILGAAKGPGL